MLLISSGHLTVSVGPAERRFSSPSSYNIFGSDYQLTDSSCNTTALLLLPSLAKLKTVNETAPKDNTEKYQTAEKEYVNTTGAEILYYVKSGNNLTRGTKRCYVI